MSPFLPETELPREPKLSCALKFEFSCVMRCEFLFVSLSACAKCNTVERLGRSFLEKVCSLDDCGVAVTLDSFEVRPIFSDHLGFPPPSADGNQNVEGQTL